MENTQTEQQKDKRIKRNEDRVKGPLEQHQNLNTYIIGVPEGEAKEKVVGNLTK